jgi:hypothetical protein
MPRLSAALLLVIIAAAVLIIVDDPLPDCRLGIEPLAVLVVDHLGSSPSNLRAVLGMARLFGAPISVHVLVGEAWQAQPEIAATTQRILAHLFVAVTAVRAVAIWIDVAHRAVLGLEMQPPRFRAVGH